ncbi:MAG: PhnD/SsuA/transferrin family substrate-binding protein [Tissierellia bacterium]|nr:PhnD/SsuA/transferrin family substrate-binding protein [Bacillota bacterium]NLL22921.1 PhnD/SsuA/transferrin family substrate-binding protein [Tissierellia bacterium]
MQKNKITKIITSLLIIAVMAGCVTGCASNTPSEPPASSTPLASGSSEVSESSGDSGSTNTKPIVITWYPNESSNTHEVVRAEVGRLVEQATGRKTEHKLTTDYTIAIEAIASGSADIAIAMGAVGYIEAKDRNPQIDVLFVNSDENWSLDGAKYFAWLCVPAENADEYKSGDTYSIDNIKGKKMSFVSNSSTSGFRVPTSSIISHFVDENLDEDKLIEGGPDMFFSEVFFGGSHQGSAVNLLSGNVDVAAFCDIEVQPYVTVKSGDISTVGSVITVREGADAPFDQYIGRDFTIIAATPVFNGPNVYNPKNLTAEEVKAIQDLFTSEEVASNKILFYDDSVEGAVGLYKKSKSYGFVLTSDSWYDPYR